MKRPVLEDSQVIEVLAGAGGPRWELMGGRLVKVETFDGFSGALAFVNEVGRLAEAMDHHPDIDIRYNRVTLALVTHDSGGITQSDLDLAGAIDAIGDRGSGGHLDGGRT